MYIAEPENVLLTANFAAGTGTLAASTLVTKPFYKWEVAPGQSTLNVEAQISEANNVRYFSVDLVAALNGFKPTAAGSDLLVRLNRLAAVVEFNDGSAVFVGSVIGINAGDYKPDGLIQKKVRGADVTGFTWTPGQAKGDAVRATLTMHLDALRMPLSVSVPTNLINA